VVLDELLNRLAGRSCSLVNTVTARLGSWQVFQQLQDACQVTLTNAGERLAFAGAKRRRAGRRVGAEVNVPGLVDRGWVLLPGLVHLFDVRGRRAVEKVLGRLARLLLVFRCG